MAKMFYTLDEAADRLGKSTDEVQEMAQSGQLQEFRDRDQLVFKREQVDLLAGGGEDDEPIGLADSGMGGSLAEESATATTTEGVEGGDADIFDPIELVDSGEQEAVPGQAEGESVLGLSDSRESTGISIFDSEELETSDPSAVTQVSDSISGPGEFTLDSDSSGSGLLDFTREADDTSLGADLLDEIYTGGEEGGEGEEVDLGTSGSGLFAGGPDDSAAGADLGSPMTMPQSVAVAYDGGWSGLGVGLAIGAIAALLLATLVLVTAMTGTLAGLAVTIAGNYPMYLGIVGGATLLLGIIGFLIGQATG